MISKQKIRLCLRLSVSTIFIGALFKVLHLQGTNVLMGIGTLGVLIFYSLYFSQKKPKSILDYSKSLLLISFLFHYIFRVLHWSYGYLFTFIFRGALVLIVVSYFYEVLFDKNGPIPNDSVITQNKLRNNLSHLLYVLAGIGIIIGSFFKILHWEFGLITGSTLLVFGLCCAVISIFMPVHKSDTE